ncbi:MULTISPECIES: WXG100 family type VII secretion target [Campylobacter]|uniref:WXG100 family type VII secretion target n=1 Tax=Campylobacter TaxID=194 RepID=UPI0011AA5956|nr:MULTISPECIES: WXG100 family type VII secretion target [Campylobacter]EII8775631.1 WXG100 family type VII secretion target [Campylobacter coli]MCV3457600.1 WXG100 family type VII secretion target [Campylobacter sp. CNRCH_2016_0050h]
MAMVHNNPDSMERFANDLRRFIDEIQNALNSLNGAYAALGEDWQDNKRVEFDENMIGFSHSIGRFSDYADESIHYILRKATELRQYQGS